MEPKACRKITCACMYIKPQSPLSLTNNVSTEIYNSKAIYLLLNLILASLFHSLLSVQSESSPLHTPGSLTRPKKRRLSGNLIFYVDLHLQKVFCSIVRCFIRKKWCYILSIFLLLLRGQ